MTPPNLKRRGALLLLLTCVLAACSSPPTKAALKAISLPTQPQEVNTLTEGQTDLASSESGVLGYLNNLSQKALEATGIKKPRSALSDRQVHWRIHASTSMNVNEQGQPVALLTRIYSLRRSDTFTKIAPEVFGNIHLEKEALGDDLISVREVQLIPHQQYEEKEILPKEARYIGIVGLFRSPAPQGWRYLFDITQAARTGLSLGAHACSMSVQIGSPLHAPAMRASSSVMRCPTTGNSF